MSSINTNSESYRNAQLSNLVYSNTFDAGTVKKNGESDTLYDQFFTKDKQGNTIFRPEVDQSARDYIGSPNSEIATMMTNYKVLDVSSNHLTGYQGIAIAPIEDTSKVTFVNRGTEPSSITGDVYNDLMIGAKTYIGIGGETSQMDDARAFADKVLRENKISEVSTVGHSLGGAIATTQASDIIAEHPEVTVKKVETYNAPQVKELLKQQGREATFEKLGEVTTSNVISNDLVHRAGDLEGNYQPVSGLNTAEGVGTFTSDNVIGKVKIFSSVYEEGVANGFTANHSILTFLEENKSSYNMSYTNEDGSLNIDSIRSVYSDLENKIAIAQQEVDSAGYMDYVLSFFGDDNPYARLEQAKAKLEEFNRLLDPYKRADGNMAFVEESQETIISADQTVVDSLGGETNKKVLDTVIDSIKLQPTQEKQEQFLDSLQNGNLLENLIGSVTTDALGIQSIDKLVLEKFQTASTQQYGDPLVVDLDGDGIETHGADGSVLFDHDADGRATGTGWATADDGLLVRDLDGSGTIDTGRELFGDNTLKADGTKAKDGFDALSDLDSNSDGVFDSADEAFDSVQVWQDKDQDGISQANELKDLSQVGVSSIDLSHQSINRATDGGVISDISTFTKIDGATAEIGNLFLDKEPARSEFTDEVAISGEILSTGIDIRGIGAVRVYIKRVSPLTL
ncbi:hypothetical protein IBE10_07390 [Francisella tularensis subsp. novicida]|uniref:lipase family protein n=1 Tax=Francisella tularensis TaxID=263 RepID=UPI0008FD3399|nr:hypothetical protein [Francisella tularensis]APC95409.1 lipase family protein [Francisella tularensis subsp. novicida]MBK2346742.1 hypothetical protein [Francisella tularensis subsp. novicida]